MHLGSSVSQPLKILAMLKSFSFRKLILLGDVFDSLNFRKLSKDAWTLLNYIGEISKTNKVRWVEGNHDEGLSDLFSALIGAQVYKEYSWQYKQKKYLAIHGHQFDRFLVDNVFLSQAASHVYSFIQKIDYSQDQKISRFVKRSSKGWLRLSAKVTREAIIHGDKMGADYVFCGHTHKSLFKTKTTPQYYNCGCWTDIPCSFISIDEKEINLLKY